MSIEFPSSGEGKSSSSGKKSMEDIRQEGCEVRCDWRRVAEDQGLDTSGFTYEQCEEARVALDLKGLSRCGMAGISVCIAATDEMFK